MARAKKDGRYVNYDIEREIYEKLEKYCEEVGQTKTVAIERILTKYLDNYFNVSEEKRIF
ncbi:MAG: hypothetical protein HFI12_12345 [Lachnospiraceae bacterium]|jgi:hypothetical protein|nr:hypothetical protein [Lachnospiraceae bacterium]